MKTLVTVLLFSMVIIFHAEAQNRQKIDSLLQITSSNSYDSLKVEAFTELVWEYYGVFNDTALMYAKKSIAIAEKTKLPVSLGNGHRHAGLVYERMANYPKALDHQQKALSYYLKADFKPGVANAYNNIAVIYKSQSDYTKALEYQEKSLKLCEEIDMKPGIAASLGNMGNIYNQLGEKDKALECYLKALQLDTEMKNDYGIGVSLVNIGSIYLKKQQYEKAIEYLDKSVEVRKKINSLQGLAISYNTLGDVYMAIKNILKAEQCYKESLRLSREAGAMESEKDANYGIYSVEKKKQKFETALLHYEEYVRLNDSIYNNQKNEELNRLRTKYELEQQETRFKEEQLLKDEKNKIEKAKLEAKAEEEHRRDQIILISVIVVLTLVILFSFFLYNRFKLTKRQNQIIESQKDVVEEKNKQITDSINYAQRIQTALLPSESDLKKIMPESFIYFLPKDIVSGDFVWLHHYCENGQNILYFAVADCTGHGVPGGFMSMLGTSFLNETVIEKKLEDPAQILNNLRNKVISSLKQNEATAESKDGMDIVFIKVDLLSRKLSYAAANNSFYLLRNNILTEYKPDKMPIGVFGELKAFTGHTIELQKGDDIFLFTDGYADQFGGEHGKKFKYVQLEKLFISIGGMNPEKQRETIHQTLSEWKKYHEQVDDICITGIRIL